MTDPRHFTDPAWGEQEARRQDLRWPQVEPEVLKTTGVITKITVAHLGAPRPTIRVPAWRKPNEDGADRVTPQSHGLGTFLCLVCHTGPVHAPDCRLRALERKAA